MEQTGSSRPPTAQISSSSFPSSTLAYHPPTLTHPYTTYTLHPPKMVLERLASYAQRLFPRPPPSTHRWPTYAVDGGWAPKPHQPSYPFHLPDHWQTTFAKGFTGMFWLWLMVRAKSDGAHELFV